jgi:hypothetical protein
VEKLWFRCDILLVLRLCNKVGLELGSIVETWTLYSYLVRINTVSCIHQKTQIKCPTHCDTFKSNPRLFLKLFQDITKLVRSNSEGGGLRGDGLIKRAVFMQE